MKLSIIAALVMSSALGACGKKEEPSSTPIHPQTKNAEVTGRQVIVDPGLGTGLVALEFTPQSDKTMTCVTVYSTASPSPGGVSCWKKTGQGPSIPQ